MDIVISAAQGGGKTKTATALVRFFTRAPHANKFNSAVAYWIEPKLYSGARIPVTEITRTILQGTRSDIIVLDEAPDWALEHLKVAVQEARKMLRRNILAIYCVQDRAVGVSDSRPWFPVGFVSALTFEEDEFVAPAPEQVENLLNAFKEGGRSRPIFVDPAVDGIIEQSIGEPYLKEPRTKRILLSLVRRIHSHGRPDDAAELIEVYKHFGADSLDSLAPAFYADAHDRIAGIYSRVESYPFVTRLAKKGKAKEVKALLEPYGVVRPADLKASDASEFLIKVSQLNDKY